MARDPVAKLRDAVREAVTTLGAEAPQEPSLERPPRAQLGDYSTNAAMLSAPALGEPPRSVAERLAERLGRSLGDRVQRVEVAGPGFVNLFLGDGWHRGAVAAILADEGFGTTSDGGERVLLEFVSANPTGPLTAAGGRGAAYGDSLARLLVATGNEVSREYYMNDAGSQIRSFAASIAARMRCGEPPQDGYSGAYIGELAEELEAAGVGPDELDRIERDGVEAMRVRIAATLERFGVRFDTWFSERSLYERGALEETVAALRAAGHVYEHEGAIWLRTTAFGDDKDRVLIRTGGEPTYFVADIAYHRDKLDRGAQRMIDPLGADHHGYVPRMRAAIAALGADPERYETPIMQLVNIVEGGERARMSKRKGEFVTLDELLDDIGVDAARYFLLQRSHDTPVDLDLSLARQQSQDNPVYYVQYAHARIASILRKAATQGSLSEEDAIAAAAGAPAPLVAPCEPAEVLLIKQLLELPEELEMAARLRAPHRLCAYATNTAAAFHAFYRDCRVVGADDERGQGLEAARLAVCLATKRVIATTLGLLGVGAPERM